METEDKFLSRKVKDKVTGFEGTAITKCIYLNGCIEYAVKPKVNKNGEMQKEEWIDVQQLIILDKKESNIPNGLRSEAQISEDNAKKRTGNGGGHRSHPKSKHR